MAEKREIVRRLRSNQSIREINRETGAHRATVRLIQEVAVNLDWLNPQSDLPNESQILEALSGTGTGASGTEHPLDKYLDEIEKWLDDKTSFLLIHEFLYHRGIELSETSIRRYIHRKYPARFTRPVTLRDTRPGEILEVDFGFFGLVYDSKEKKNRKAWFLSARLRHSRHTYRQMTFNQRQQTFYSALINAFEHFGGIPEKVVPDNMKSAVIQASFTDPEVNRSFQKMAIHYGFLISPTLPHTPRHKGGVESDVKYVKGNFWPRFKEAQKQKGHSIPHAETLQAALELWDSGVADQRIVRGLGRSPAELFKQERDTLQSLPLSRWSILSMAQAKVQQTWRIQYENAFYSVPYQYIGERVMVLADSNMVTIYLKEKEIARHMRAVHDWEIKRSDHHAPPGADRVCHQTRESLLQWAGDIGGYVHKMSLAIFNRQGIDGIQSVRSLCHLASHHGADRLDSACNQALKFKATRYREVKKILLEDTPATQEEKVSPVYRFQRELGYFDSNEAENTGEVHCG